MNAIDEYFMENDTRVLFSVMFLKTDKMARNEKRMERKCDMIPLK